MFFRSSRPPPSSPASVSGRTKLRLLRETQGRAELLRSLQSPQTARAALRLYELRAASWPNLFEWFQRLAEQMEGRSALSSDAPASERLRAW